MQKFGKSDQYTQIEGKNRHQGKNKQSMKNVKAEFVAVNQTSGDDSKVYPDHEADIQASPIPYRYL